MEKKKGIKLSIKCVLIFITWHLTKLFVPPPKHISLIKVSSLDVSSTNSSKQGSAAGWKVRRDSVAF